QEWAYLVAIYDESKTSGTEFSAYINGELISENLADGNILTTTGALLIGKRINSRYFQGTIDELRLSDVVRSGDYVKTTFNNLNDPESFITLGKKHSQNKWPVPELSFRKNITFDSSVVSGSSDLYNFPYLLELYDSDMKNRVQTNGNDILFTDFNGVPFAHEIEEFDRNFNSTHVYLRAWVKIPKLSASPVTQFIMYYGNEQIESLQNPTGVWDEGYEGVFHFEDCCKMPNSVLDSSENGLVLKRISGQMSSSSWVSGFIGTGLDFDNTDGLNATTSGTTISDFTFSTWFKADATSGRNDLVTISSSRRFGIKDGHLYFHDGGDIEFSNEASFSTGSWYYGTVTYNGTYISVFLNGDEKTPLSRTIGSYSSRMAVGYRPT
ncbi:hypothetical protein LCGC14_2927420, partial [marine sediment metagenome]